MLGFLKPIAEAAASALKIAERKDGRIDGINAQKSEYLQQQQDLMRTFRLSEQRSKQEEAAERRKQRYGG